MLTDPSINCPGSSLARRDVWRARRHLTDHRGEAVALLMEQPQHRIGAAPRARHQQTARCLRAH